MSDMIVKVDIYACRIAHYRLNCHQILVHPVKIAFLIPNVSIHFLLECHHIAVVELLLSIIDGFLYKRIASDLYFLCVVCARSEGRVDVDKIHLHALVLQIGTCGKTLTVHDDVSLSIFAYCFALSHFINGHSALYSAYHLIIVLIVEHTLGPGKAVEACLSFEGFGIVWYVSYCHSVA